MGDALDDADGVAGDAADGVPQLLEYLSLTSFTRSHSHTTQALTVHKIHTIHTRIHTDLVPLLVNHIAQRDKDGILAVKYGGSGTVTPSGHNPDGDKPTPDPDQFGHFTPALPNDMPWGADPIPLAPIESHKKDDSDEDMIRSHGEDDSDEDMRRDDTSDEEELKVEQPADHQFIDLHEDEDGNTLVKCDHIRCGRYRRLHVDIVRAEGWAQDGADFFCSDVGGDTTPHELPCDYCNDTGTSPVLDNPDPACDCVPGKVKLATALPRERRSAAWYEHVTQPRAVPTSHSTRPQRSHGHKRNFEES